jgi:hypothetical protein
MHDMPEETQESRTMVVGVRVTPREYHAVAWVAGVKGTDMSTLIRQLVIEPLMEEHARLAKAVESVA